MNKQQFLGASLHTGLKLWHSGGLAVPMSYNENKNWKEDGFSISQALTYHYLLPIARPLSDIYKQISHNSETFVPIIELAKIAGYKHVDKHWAGQVGASASVTKTFTYSNELGFHLVMEDDHYYSDENTIEEKIIEVNQLGLFQKLIEWHFDVAGLIDKNEAININNIENPYK